MDVVQEPEDDRPDFADRFEAIKEDIKVEEEPVRREKEKVEKEQNLAAKQKPKIKRNPDDDPVPEATAKAKAKPEAKAKPPVEASPEEPAKPEVTPAPEIAAISERAPHRPPFASFDEIIPREVKPEPSNVTQIKPALTPREEPVARDEPVAREQRVENRDEPSVVNEGAPDVIDLAQRYAATLKPVEDLEPEETEPESESAADEAAQQQEAPRPMRKPALLMLLIAGLAAVPLTKSLPPLEVGPSAPGSPFFGLVPALGITASMVWQPNETVSGEWVPVTTVPPSQPLMAAAPAVASYQVEMPQLEAPVFAAAFQSIEWTDVTALPPKGRRDLLRAPIFNVLEGEHPSVSPRPKPRLEDQASTDPVLPVPLAPAEATVDGAAAELAVPSIANPERPSPPFSLLELTILVPPTAKDAVAYGIADDAEWRGHIVAQIKKVDVNINERNLRYFHDGDRLEARRLAGAYDAELRDFTWFQPKPERGTTELWLSGSGAGEARQTVVPLEFLERALDALSGN